MEGARQLAELRAFLVVTQHGLGPLQPAHDLGSRIGLVQRPVFLIADRFDLQPECMERLAPRGGCCLADPFVEALGMLPAQLLHAVSHPVRGGGWGRKRMAAYAALDCQVDLRPVELHTFFSDAVFDLPDIGWSGSQPSEIAFEHLQGSKRAQAGGAVRNNLRVSVLTHELKVSL